MRYAVKRERKREREMQLREKEKKIRRGRDVIKERKRRRF
jgi:hypothetical protein